MQRVCFWRRRDTGGGLQRPEQDFAWGKWRSSSPPKGNALVSGAPWWRLRAGIGRGGLQVLAGLVDLGPASASSRELRVTGSGLAISRPSLAVGWRTGWHESESRGPILEAMPWTPGSVSPSLHPLYLGPLPSPRLPHQLPQAPLPRSRPPRAGGRTECGHVRPSIPPHSSGLTGSKSSSISKVKEKWL